MRAYLALTRDRNPGPVTASPGARPPGPLIWFHLPSYSGPTAISTLLARTREEIGPLTAVVTFDKVAPGTTATQEPDDFLIRLAPAENQRDSALFIKHWQPDLMIWVGGPFRPVLLNEVDEAGIPRVLINARADALGSVTGTWVPGMSRALIGPFRHVLTTDEEAAGRLSRMGIDMGSLEVCGQFDDDPDPPACSETERNRLATNIGTRPIWLAAHVPPTEIDSLILAQRTAQKRAHRLMLVLVPSHGQNCLEIKEMLEDQGVLCTLRSDNVDPDENTEILIADTRGELGLWMRLAPITYLGGTLSGSPSIHPYLPAALGSAVVHGPEHGSHAVQVSRMARARASREVPGAEELGRMVERLMPPDQVAAMAHAGWTIVAENAAVTNRLTEIIIDVLEEAYQA